jgi:hypothetical protein
MTKIATVTVGSGGSSTVSFTNIPQTYTDLKLLISGRTSRSAVYGEMHMRFNGSSTDYSARALEATGSTAGSYTETSIRVELNGNTATASTFGNAEFYIPNYTSSNYKSVSLDSVTENNATAVDSFFKAQLWSNTAAITQIDIGYGTGTISEFSTFTLYGIRNARRTAGNSIKATGGNISFDGTYVYHVFSSSGKFTPSQGLTAQVMSLGGGGGGGRQNGGGGGAGELDLFSSYSLSSTDYTVTVGAGGAGSSSSAAQGTLGGTTSFGALVTSLGGGGGGSAGSSNQTGVTGGSGGGGASNNGSPAGGSASGSNTNAGGSGIDSYPNGAAGGGGGGATAAGSNGTTSSNAGVGGAGGAGYTLTNIDNNFTTSFPGFGGMTVIASGGGGGSVRQTSGAESTGGLGGTGAGNGGKGSNDAQTTAPTNATSYGSGGGGGGGVGAAGSNGYAGIVIIRYKA